MRSTRRRLSLLCFVALSLVPLASHAQTTSLNCILRAPQNSPTLTNSSLDEPSWSNAHLLGGSLGASSLVILLVDRDYIFFTYDVAFGDVDVLAGTPSAAPAIEDGIPGKMREAKHIARSVILDSYVGILYFADYATIRSLNLTSGRITTHAGSVAGVTGTQDGAALSATMDTENRLAIYPYGDGTTAQRVYFISKTDDCLRKYDIASDTVTSVSTICGNNDAIRGVTHMAAGGSTLMFLTTAGSSDAIVEMRIVTETVANTIGTGQFIDFDISPQIGAGALLDPASDADPNCEMVAFSQGGISQSRITFNQNLCDRKPKRFGTPNGVQGFDGWLFIARKTDPWLFYVSSECSTATTLAPSEAAADAESSGSNTTIIIVIVVVAAVVLVAVVIIVVAVLATRRGGSNAKQKRRSAPDDDSSSGSDGGDGGKPPPSDEASSSDYESRRRRRRSASSKRSSGRRQRSGEADRTDDNRSEEMRSHASSAQTGGVGGARPASSSVSAADTVPAPSLRGSTRREPTAAAQQQQQETSAAASPLAPQSQDRNEPFSQPRSSGQQSSNALVATTKSSATNNNGGNGVVASSANGDGNAGSGSNNNDTTMDDSLAPSITHTDFNGAVSDADIRRHKRRREYVVNRDFMKGKLLGRGANGSVFTAVLGDGSSVAMKEVNLTGEIGEMGGQMAEVKREMELLAELRHPNLVAYYGVYCDKQAGSIQLFMELVAGGSLGSLVRGLETPLPESTIRRYVVQITDGLAFMHERGVVHRDLKADNLLVASDTGLIKIADFGTARSLGVGSMQSRAAQTMVGTPYFMAPEILIGQDGEDGYGTKADIWSLGITVLELLRKGNPPWPVFANPGQAFLHIASPGNSPIIPENLSPACKDFCKRCTDRDPRARATALELLQHPWLRSEDDC